MKCSILSITYIFLWLLLHAAHQVSADESGTDWSNLIRLLEIKANNLSHSDFEKKLVTTLCRIEEGTYGIVVDDDNHPKKCLYLDKGSSLHSDDHWEQVDQHELDKKNVIGELSQYSNNHKYGRIEAVDKGFLYYPKDLNDIMIIVLVVPIAPDSGHHKTPGEYKEKSNYNWVFWFGLGAVVAIHVLFITWACIHTSRCISETQPIPKIKD